MRNQHELAFAAARARVCGPGFRGSFALPLGAEALGEVAVGIVNLEETAGGNRDSVGKDDEGELAGVLAAAPRVGWSLLTV
jgi:hypothetical protein